MNSNGSHSEEPRARPAHVVVDDREPVAIMEPLLREAGAANVEVRRLRVGDYIVDGRIVFERKTAEDFARSLLDGRLFRQSCELLSGPSRSCLILEGKFSGPGSAGVSREALQGALITLTVIMGIPVLRSMNEAETARLVCLTGKQVWRRSGGAVVRAGYRPRGKRRRQLFILQGLPGVGPHRAARLLEHFGSIISVVSADVDALAAVEGIGRRTAHGIVSIVQEGGTTRAAMEWA